MWSSIGEDHNNSKNDNTNSSSKGLSRGSSSSSTSSSTSLFSPLSNSRAKTMEEVWKDINLSSLQDHPSKMDRRTTIFRGTIVEDFLARPLAKDPPTSVICSGYGSTVPPPATMLTLNSGHDLHFFGNSDFLKQNPLLRHQTFSQVCSVNAPCDALASSSGINAHGKKIFSESDNNSGDRRHKRMINNRESAARSRARKQAYTNELELEVAHLMEENARLKKQQQQLCLAAAAQLPKKHTLHRTSSAPF